MVVCGLVLCRLQQLVASEYVPNCRRIVNRNCWQYVNSCSWLQTCCPWNLNKKAEKCPVALRGTAASAASAAPSMQVSHVPLRRHLIRRTHKIYVCFVIRMSLMINDRRTSFPIFVLSSILCVNLNLNLRNLISEEFLLPPTSVVLSCDSGY